MYLACNILHLSSSCFQTSIRVSGVMYAFPMDEQMKEYYNMNVSCFTISYTIWNLLPPANEVCEGYVFTGVCLSAGGCVCPIACWDTHTPWDQGQTPSWADTPSLADTLLPGQTPPGQIPPRQTPRSRPLWTFTPPCAVHAGIRSTSGRYASHWNAFLPVIFVLFLTTSVSLLVFWEVTDAKQIN